MKKIIILIFSFFFISTGYGSCIDSSKYNYIDNEEKLLQLYSIWDKIYKKNTNNISNIIDILVKTNPTNITKFFKDYFVCRSGYISMSSLPIWVPNSKKNIWYKWWKFDFKWSPYWNIKEIFDSRILNPKYIDEKDFKKDPFISLHQFKWSKYSYPDENGVYKEWNYKESWFWIKNQFKYLRDYNKYLTLTSKENIPAWQNLLSVSWDWFRTVNDYCTDNVIRYKFYIPKWTEMIVIKNSYQWDWNSTWSNWFIQMVYKNNIIDYNNIKKRTAENITTFWSDFKNGKTYSYEFNSSWQKQIILSQEKWYIDKNMEWWVYMTIFSSWNESMRNHYITVDYWVDIWIFTSWYNSLKDSDFNDFWDLYDKHDVFIEKNYKFCKQKWLIKHVDNQWWGYNYTYAIAEKPVNLKYWLNFKK